MKAIEVFDGDGDQYIGMVPVQVFDTQEWREGAVAFVSQKEAGLLVEDLHNIEFPQRDVVLHRRGKAYKAVGAFAVGHHYDNFRWIKSLDTSVASVTLIGESRAHV